MHTQATATGYLDGDRLPEIPIELHKIARLQRLRNKYAGDQQINAWLDHEDFPNPWDEAGTRYMVTAMLTVLLE